MLGSVIVVSYRELWALLAGSPGTGCLGVCVWDCVRDSVRVCLFLNRDNVVIMVPNDPLVHCLWAILTGIVEMACCRV